MNYFQCFWVVLKTEFKLGFITLWSYMLRIQCVRWLFIICCLMDFKYNLHQLFYPLNGFKKMCLHKMGSKLVRVIRILKDKQFWRTLLLSKSIQMLLIIEHTTGNTIFVNLDYACFLFSVALLFGSISI